MRRADRRDSNDDHSNQNPRARQTEPLSYHELKSRYVTARAQRDEWQQKAREQESQLTQVQQEASEKESQFIQVKQEFSQVQQQYFQEQERYQQTLVLYKTEQKRYQETVGLYEAEQTKNLSLLVEYETEKSKVIEWQTKYETAWAEREQYLTLYEESRSQLEFERRSKAGIKGWETRRKRENERLKQEISAMTVLLRDSLAKKDEAVSSLYEIADRMDRIQQLVDSVDQEPNNNPVNLIQKFKRIWYAVKEILAE